MRNRAKIIGLLVCLSFNIHICKAQWIDNKINISAGFQLGMFHGGNQVQDKNFIFPAFYKNLNHLRGISAKALYSVHPYISCGIRLAQSHASDWEFENNPDYLESKTKISSLATIIQFHNKFSQQGIFNRYKFFAEISPMIGISSLSSSNQLIDIQSPIGIAPTPTKSNDKFYGFMGSAGIEWTYSQSNSLYISYTFQRNRVSSIFYNDTHFAASQLNFGIVFKLMKNKHFL